MCNDNVIRRFAAVFVLLSVAAAYYISPLWLFATVFVAINLFQSSLTGFCPLERMLGRAGLFGCVRRRA